MASEVPKIEIFKWSGNHPGRCAEALGVSRAYSRCLQSPKTSQTSKTKKLKKTVYTSRSEAPKIIFFKWSGNVRVVRTCLRTISSLFPTLLDTQNMSICQHRKIEIFKLSKLKYFLKIENLVCKQLQADASSCKRSGW